jgi:hypothetical protein
MARSVMIVRRRLDVDEIRRQDRDRAQDHVDGSEQHFAEPVTSHVLAQQRVQAAQDQLVSGTRRRGHLDQLALVQLVAAAVVRQRGVVVVGVNDSRRHRVCLRRPL